MLLPALLAPTNYEVDAQRRAALMQASRLLLWIPQSG